MFDDLREEIILYCISKYPEEATGIITYVKRNKKYKFIPVDNMSDDKENHFKIDPDILLKHKNIQAIIHSHPDADNEPSYNDIQSQIDTQLIFGIISIKKQSDGTIKNDGDIYYWGDTTHNPNIIETIPNMPLEGRLFRNGPSGTDGKGDCYAIVKDWYKQHKNIILPEYARGSEWWKEGQNLYMDGFKSAGFIDVTDEVKSSNIPQVGDIGLMSINSPVPNHAIIYIDNNLMLHHLANRLSRTEPIGRWSKFITVWLRYKK